MIKNHVRTIQDGVKGIGDRLAALEKRVAELEGK